MRRLTCAAAVAAVVQFVMAWAVLGAVRENYDPVAQAISELSEVGSPTRAAMSASLIAFGLGMATFAPTLHHALPGGSAPAAAVFMNAVGSIGVGVFPCSPGCPGAAAATNDLAHILAASLAYAGLIAAPLASARSLHRASAQPGLRRASLVLGLLTLVGVVTWATGSVEASGGALQRVATTVGDAWYLVAAVAIMRGGGQLAV